MMYLSFDEDNPGFKKNYFAAGQRRGGTTSLLKLELPSKWSKYLSNRDIETNINSLFKAHDLKVHGGEAAQARYDDWKHTNSLQKREQKLTLKAKHDALSEVEKQKQKA